ncbi:MAG: DMT family transporter [bacterium]
MAALLLACFIWGSTFALVKAALRDADALSFLALRFGVALAAAALLGGASLRGTRPADWARGAAAGAALYGGFFFQTQGLRFTTAANSAFITSLCVIMVPFIMWLGGRRPRKAQLAGAAAALSGLYLLSGADFARTGLGDLRALACAAVFALHIVCLGAFGGRLAPLRFFTLQVAAAAALALLAALALGGPVRWSGEVLTALLVTGLLATALAFYLQTWAQRRLETARASLWLLTEPLFALGFGLALLGEVPPPLALAGAALTLAGVAVSEAREALALRPGRPATSSVERRIPFRPFQAPSGADEVRGRAQAE